MLAKFLLKHYISINMLKSIGERIKKIDEFLGSPVALHFIIFLIAITIGFGLGYLYRGEIKHVPIIIEKHL